MQQQKKIPISWSPSFAYIVGMIATDGNMSSDERHISITSKDNQILTDIKKFFCIKNKLSKKASGTTKEKKYYVLQIGDKNFYNFLISIGIEKNKSKTIQKVIVPKKLFFHFLRGCFDGDGNIQVSKHKESKEKQLRIRLASASKQFVLWIQKEIKLQTKVEGGWIYSPKEKSWHVLSYGKKDSIHILRRMYTKSTIHLKRKHRTAKQFLII